MFFINHTDIGEGSAAIIEVEGPLNSDSAPDFDDYASKLADNNVVHLLLDLRNLNFISSEGIGATLMLQKSINKKNGLVIFFNLNNEITLLFKLLGFDKLLTIASDRAEALQILDRHMELFQKDTSVQSSDKGVTEKYPSFDETSSILEKDLPGDDSFAVFEDQEETAEEEEEEGEDESFIIECVKCSSLIRIKESGDQLCPYCSAEFTVTDDKKAVFRVKDIQS